MKRCISLVLCLGMLLSISVLSVSTSAVTADNLSDISEIISGEWTYVDILCDMTEEVMEFTITSSGISPYANPTNLKYVQNAMIASSATNINYNVTPTKGRSLRVWLESSGSINLTVRRTGLVSYPKVYGQTFGAGDRDVETVASCDGKQYVVQISGPVGTVYSMLIYETGG